MSQLDTRALTRNTYTLDAAGLLAHTRDTLRQAAARFSRAGEPPRHHERPRSRGGPSIRGAERHGQSEAYRIR